MFDFDETSLLVLAVYFGACAGLYLLKPKTMFDTYGNFRHFGLHDNETVFPFWLVTTIIGLTMYYMMVLWRLRD